MKMWNVRKRTLHIRGCDGLNLDQKAVMERAARNDGACGAVLAEHA